MKPARTFELVDAQHRTPSDFLGDLTLAPDGHLLYAANIFHDSILVVNPQSGLHDVSELTALARSQPGEMLCANVGVGSLPHLCGVLFEQEAGIKLVHVPYPGSPESVTDLVAGRIAMVFSVGSSCIGQINAG